MDLKIITANKVKNGAVVYLSADKWSEHINDSAISSSEKEEKKLEEKAKKSVETQVVIDPYLIEVIQKNGNIVPTRYRELIRAKGPTTDPKLKKNN